MVSGSGEGVTGGITSHHQVQTVLNPRWATTRWATTGLQHLLMSFGICPEGWTLRPQL